MATNTSAELLSTLVDDLAAAIEAVGGSTVAVAQGSGIAGQGWTFSLSVTGALRGTAHVSLDAAGVTALLQLVLGPEADTSDGAARDLLSELMSQALGGLKSQPSFADVSVTLAGLERSSSPAGETACYSLVLGEAALQVVADATLEPGATHPEAPGPIARPSPSAPQAAATTARRAGQAAPSPAAALPGNLDVVLDIELPLSVRFGSTLMSIRALSTLGPGSIVDMGRSPDDPVEILVCGRPIARAEVVIVGGNYGVRITDLTSAAERIRAMEGQL